MDEAIHRHGVWAGGWMGAARICRCHPWGTAGFDPVPDALEPSARWYRPWRYGLWRRCADPRRWPRWRSAEQLFPRPFSRLHPECLHARL